MIVAVLAGGRSRRMGAPKALALLGGEPLILRPLAAARAAGLPAIVVAKRRSPLPELDVPVIYEPDEPAHPLVGLIAALEHAGEIVAVACDQPWVTGEVIAALAGATDELVTLCATNSSLGHHRAETAALPSQPFPGRYRAAALPALRAALARQAPVRATLAELAPATIDITPFGDPDRIAASVNTPEELAAAEALL